MPYRIGPILLAAALTFTLGGCERHSVTGTYIARFSNAVKLLQLVETPGGQVTGQLEEVVLSADGKLDETTASVTGAASDGKITFSIKPIAFLPIGVPASGSVEGNQLSLVVGLPGMKPDTETYSRGEVSEFQVRAEALRRQSQSILSAKAAEEAHQAEIVARARAAEEAAQARARAVDSEKAFIAQVDLLLQRIGRFERDADTHIGRFPGAEQRYQEISAKIGSYLGHERSLAGNPSASLARSQLSVAISQTTLATEGLHQQALNFQNDFTTALQPLAAALAQSENECRRPTDSAPDHPMPPDPAAWADACQRLAGGVSTFKTKYEALQAGLRHLEGVYQQERQTQQDMVGESNRLE